VAVTQPVSVLTRPLVDHGGDVKGCDGLVDEVEGKEQESCIQGRRVTKSLANAGRFTSTIVQGSTHGSDGRGDSVAGASSE
jgi:hypothetical protein